MNDDYIIHLIKKDIAKYKKALEKEALRKGISENWGQKYVRELLDRYTFNEDKYPILTQKITRIIQEFNTFCMNCDSEWLTCLENKRNERQV